jgi:hypothetical protein
MTRLSIGRIARRLVPRSWTRADVAFFAVVFAMTAYASAVFWLPRCLSLQDYNQFLVFVRVALDIGDPSSPFHDTYALAPWFTPTSLPVHLTAVLSRVVPGGIETAGKILLSLQYIGLVGASLFLLRQIGWPRWCVVLIFPLIHSGWTFGGFFSYSTSIPWIVLGIALTIRWFRLRARGPGLAVAACLVVTLLWHGIAFFALGLAFAVLWLAARFPRWRDRVLAAVPAIPSLALFCVWQWSTFDPSKPHGAPPQFTDFWDAVEVFGWFGPEERGASAHGWALLLLVLLIQLSSNRLIPGRSPPSEARLFRVSNPMLLVGAAYVVAYFTLPRDLYHVEGFGNRFASLSLLCLVFTWRLPEGRALRAAAVGVMVAIGLVSTTNIARRMRDLGRRTNGASELIDRLERYDTLYYAPRDRGTTPEFVHALIELEQIATVRKGGLPNSSFAGYGYTYVRYVGGRNPMPGLSGTQGWSDAMKAFDYVLASEDEPIPSSKGFKLVAKNGAWSLYGVCGSHRFPKCD